jgi:hypothetical protein
MHRSIEFEDFVGRSIGQLVGHTNRRRWNGAFTKIRSGVSTHELLEELRGRMIAAAGDSWRIEVYSIVDDSTHRWIQLGLAGREERTVLLKLPYLADADDAIGSIAHWVRDSSCQHAVVDVTTLD